MEEQTIRKIADVQSEKKDTVEQRIKPEDKFLPEHVMGPSLTREISRDNPQMEEGGFYRDKKTVQLIGASGTQKAVAVAMACGELDGPAEICDTGKWTFTFSCLIESVLYFLSLKRLMPL